MSRVDGLGFRSKPDLLQRHKLVQTQTYPFIEKREKGLREGIQKRRKNYCQSKFLFYKKLLAMNQWEIMVRTKDDQYERVDYRTIFYLILFQNSVFI